jgi:L-lactate dehydrogenase complex protein LldF
MPHLDPRRFAENARAALADPVLHGALQRATDLFADKRAQALAEAPEWQELRERARAIKQAVLARLDSYLEQFERAAIAAGTQVHWARDAAEACRILLELATRAGERPGIVKAKSMATEEIHLNQALEAEGLAPVETDLGEWIVQLAGEVPSHIVAPAIHKTRHQVGELFARELGVEATGDEQALTAIARRFLRERFAAAGLGVSGANFLVAETGSLLLIENEGNIRLCTSLPRVHVAVVGIEKLVPRLADLELFLQLLPRSASGQRLTSYMSLLTGPVPPGGEGPKELHVVLLDNGRSQLLAEGPRRETLACLRCGACLNVCPVFQQVGGHAYGAVYPGPIGSVLMPQIGGIEAHRELPFASSLCGACRDACPVMIDLPGLLLDLRAEIVRREAKGPRRSEQRAWRVWAWAMSSAGRYRLAARAARLAQGLGLTGSQAGRRLPPLEGWTRTRELRPLASRSFRELWAEERGR